ncbi:unnamed protein product [Prorocentrum cordatum]|uniref:Uncharacterized protein n=1 Tax=Prorocentrum cordatum TaxID=2364126 RepID=A0ABN9WX40_9DINO|nr:unnamed protein product [Polarella glacialis]
MLPAPPVGRYGHTSSQAGSLMGGLWRPRPSRGHAARSAGHALLTPSASAPRLQTGAATAGSRCSTPGWPRREEALREMNLHRDHICDVLAAPLLRRGPALDGSEGGPLLPPAMSTAAWATEAQVMQAKRPAVDARTKVPWHGFRRDELTEYTEARFSSPRYKAKASQ